MMSLSDESGWISAENDVETISSVSSKFIYRPVSEASRLDEARIDVARSKFNKNAALVFSVRNNSGSFQKLSDSRSQITVETLFRIRSVRAATQLSYKNVGLSPSSKQLIDQLIEFDSFSTKFNLKTI